jgi:hypothetical protein
MAVISLAISVITSRTSFVLTIGLTSAGTVAVTLATAMRSAKKKGGKPGKSDPSDPD